MNKVIAIAIDNYADPLIGDLKNCCRDVNSLIDVVSRSYEFESITLYNKPEQTTHQFLYDELYNEFINALEEDSILIVYAGHGEFNEVLGATYWLCSDSQRNSVTTWFNVGDLLSFFQASPASHIALISDSCFAGAVFALRRGGGLTALAKKTSRQALTSGGIELVGDGRNGDNSPFSRALVKVLSENTSPVLTFNTLSELTILEFDPNRSQTPSFGPLVNSGDKGGAFLFRLKIESEYPGVKSIQIPLDLGSEIRADNQFEIPFFLKNDAFNSDFINAFVQQLAYSIVNEIRSHIVDDIEYHVERTRASEYYIEVGYVIHTWNNKYLSITIGRSDYFGGPHPNHYVYSINFAFKPERKLSLSDLIDFSAFNNIESFLLAMIDKYGENEDDRKEVLREYSTWEYIDELGFCFNTETFSIIYMNLLSHAIKSYGFLEIPIHEIKFRV